MSIVVSVVGNSKSGKTTLLSRIIPLLKKRGYTVCVIKHSGHLLSHTDFDHEGKDTFTFSQAGADEVWLTSSGLTYHLISEERSLERMVASSQADVILVEGFKSAPTKKIVLITPGEPIDIAGTILEIVQGEYNPEDIVEKIIHS
ncbi:MAG: molybdopterin-guanine dinucleotide biosynthesis protein B [Theionarchaea archaeon]|nr:molybdopterin-guanine dinucleotide biosynthesis protein B [Theionarchaea archaeon]MBU7001989.1 molybdopterin-guanine dinucleotide biosynthesis protein B [Theionarchaea archaeon]MBU7019760.1 molybdopterin-guanine dinucleotide biosynthesis protein B [Theionarchaea archaeon]MBU7034620.1 molybdopterin-guanine dinucleotide biosynthesis protein B [Theionarchaea archaeon]MBU7040623.1 molybdopterin-guanine dinucleotide biosynthesis protein B [Theionarchaea archaeon]